MPAPRPLFNLPALLANPESAVYVAEGEKSVDALTSLGLLATTSAGGAGAARQADWTPLAGRRVVILPDKDDAGDTYSETVRGILLGLGSEVQVAHLDGRPENGGDVADLLERCQSDADRVALKDTLFAITTSPVQPGDPLPPAPSLTAYRQFPTAALPEPIRAVVTEAAESIVCDEAVIALPCLTALGVALANWRLVIKGGWITLPAVWTVVARPSGSQKSPALDVPLDYFRKRQEELVDEYCRGAVKGKSDRPKTIWTDNATTEGLDEAFKSNRRGILYGCDELSGWLGTFGLYKNGHSASDEGWYCKRHTGRASYIVRKKSGQQHGCASGLLAVTGCITVETLRTLLTRSVRESGLMARLVFCMPPEKERRWTDSTLSEESRQRYYSLLDRLFEDNAPRVAHLSPEAKSLWVAFYCSHNEESKQLDSDDLKAAFSKLEELPARLALILHVAEGHSGDVTGDVMARAIDIAEWAKNETRRAYVILRPRQRDSALTPDRGQLLELMARKGPIRVRQVQAGCRPYKKKSATETKADLDGLVATGHARLTPDGAYACVVSGSPESALTPPAPPPPPAPTPLGADGADTADVLTGDIEWTKL